MKKHFVTFYSPGTLFAEQTEKSIHSWSIKTAQAMAKKITERYGAKPYGFRFTTRERGPNDLDSKQTKHSAMYYIHCRVRTLAEIEADNDPRNAILLSNMRCNGWDKIVEPTRGWKCAFPLEKGDAVLDDSTKGATAPR